MVKLNIPYRSQWDKADAGDYSADCGPTCLAMIFNYYQIEMTPNEVYEFLPEKKPKDYVKIGEMMNAGAAKNITLTYENYKNQYEAVSNLRENLDAGLPVIALIKYEPWQKKTGNPFKWGHFIVVTGYENGSFFFHDPLFGVWQPAGKGSHFKMTEYQFCKGWGGFAVEENPNWACLVVEEVGGVIPEKPVLETAVETISEPEVVPEPSSPIVDQPEKAAPEQPPDPEPEIAVTPAPPTTVANKMDDINLRVRALAAYRWAKAPDPQKPEEMQIWLDNLGDWGLTYDEYVVRPGDSLTLLAGRLLGDQRHWHALEVYNDLVSRSLWLGVTIRIPRMGDAGTYNNPVLPKDDAGYEKGVDEWVEADMAAEDYNDIGPSTFGVGYLD